ncbi:VOC family protein [Streptomyces marincola]|uniref:Glyoxalase n=1 Tax=Streptomyces marincola TaxID=2878388 RepID=A0A1W7CY97_9ACTN|nr:VOC family protein [Streptomyces marincola]ARQ69783.1 glyoxalase [Streptomyces marincola]
MTPRLDLIGIVSDDIPASLAFYRRLGVDIPEGAESEPHVETTLPGGLRLAWDDAKVFGDGASGGDRPTARRIVLSFLCDSPADVDAQYADLVRAGYTGEKEPWDAFWGQRYAVVLDPDGNGIDLFAWLGTDQAGS